jgi:hypothetical protein
LECVCFQEFRNAVVERFFRHRSSQLHWMGDLKRGAVCPRPDSPDQAEWPGSLQEAHWLTGRRRASRCPSGGGHRASETRDPGVSRRMITSTWRLFATSEGQPGRADEQRASTGVRLRCECQLRPAADRRSYSWVAALTPHSQTASGLPGLPPGQPHPSPAPARGSSQPHQRWPRL